MKIGLTAIMVAGLLLSGMVSAAEKTPPQEKKDDETMCNQPSSSQNLKGDARKTFMSQCLKKS